MTGEEPKTSDANADERPIVLLDRDGVVNEDDGDYVTSIDAWRPIPGSLEAIARLTRAGFDVVVVTNQSAIGRGLIDEPTLEAIHAEMRAAVAARGGRLAGVLHCPHHPADGCACRKPGTALIRQAETLLGRPVRGAPFVGDKWSDVLAARRAGCRPVLVRTGHGRATIASAKDLDDVAIRRDLAEAVEDILRSAGR
jgi:D-glycero-D-manno-heptose 1,7-bisphosphate phosphatase